MKRGHCLMGLTVVVATWPLQGCWGGSDETPKPKPPAVFDPQNAESTFRWVIRNAQPLLAASKLASVEQSNNPLHKDQQNAYEQERRRWKEFLNKMGGTQVLWPVYVERISIEAVDVYCIPDHFQDDGIKVEAHFTKYPVGLRDHFDGRLVIGESITLEEAKRLDRGTAFWVQGVIEEVLEGVTGSSGDYVIIHINQTRALLPQAQPDRAPPPGA